MVYASRPAAGGWSDIYCYDLTSGSETTLTTSGMAVSPVIWGDRVVYFDARDGASDIYCYDLSSGIERKLDLPTAAASSRGGLDIYEDTIVYSCADSYDVGSSTSIAMTW